jgi:hypothetical protein
LHEKHEKDWSHGTFVAWGGVRPKGCLKKVCTRARNQEVEGTFIICGNTFLKDAPSPVLGLSSPFQQEKIICCYKK